MIDANGHNLGLNGTLKGIGGLIKTGAGIVTLSGTNTYTGGTTVSVGTLVVNGANALPNGGNLTVGTPLIVTAANWSSAGVTLALGGDGNLHAYTTGTTTDVVASQVPATVTSVGISAPSNTTANLTIDSTGNPVPAGGLTYSGPAGGVTTGGLIIIGSGTVTLSGKDKYTGSTTVSAGKLTISSVNALPHGGSLTVGNGSKFAFDSSSDAAPSVVVATTPPVIASSVDTIATSSDTSAATSAATSSDAGVASAEPSSASLASSSLVVLARHCRCCPHPRPLSRKRARGAICPHHRPRFERARGAICRPRSLVRKRVSRHPLPLSRRARGACDRRFNPLHARRHRQLHCRCCPHPRPLSQRARGEICLHPLPLSHKQARGAMTVRTRTIRSSRRSWPWRPDSPNTADNRREQIKSDCAKNSRPLTRAFPRCPGTPRDSWYPTPGQIAGATSPRNRVRMRDLRE